MPMYNSQRLRGFAKRVTRRASRFFKPEYALGAAASNSAIRLFKRAKKDLAIKRKVRKYVENDMKTQVIGRKLKRPRSMAPPTTTSARLSAKYAVAPRMTKFKKQKVSAQKVPKSAISHYKEFGEFNAEKCMYINHEHFGSIGKFWYGISLGLAKKLLAYGKIYNGKSLEDPCIGPRTKAADPREQLDDKSGGTVLQLIFIKEAQDGAVTRLVRQGNLENTGASPDVYLSMDAIAVSIAGILRNRYMDTFADGSAHDLKCYLAEAAILVGTDTANAVLNAQPIYIQNLDDAEICLYVNSLVKFQNVTAADGGGLTKDAIDANPLKGRMYTGKGHFPQIDADLLQVGQKSLGPYFGNVNDTTYGITLCGHANTHNADDLGRISHIPAAKELYGNQTVSSGVIHMPAGSMKFHKTSFSFKATFKTMCNYFLMEPQGTTRGFGRHTLFGLTPAHKHGEDTIKIGFNRETDVGCYIKHKRIVHPLKTNYTIDAGVITTSVVPTEHGNPY